ncbi:excalibur calcium-binding domain-containing protein [Streptomyces sp. M10(2022)]
MSFSRRSDAVMRAPYRRLRSTCDRIPAAVAPPSTPKPKPKPKPKASTKSAVHQGNCDAVPAAGRPVHSGDPGYGSHLDRDGDGVACE